jgi:hypothetical protein
MKKSNSNNVNYNSVSKKKIQEISSQETTEKDNYGK